MLFESLSLANVTGYCETGVKLLYILVYRPHFWYYEIAAKSLYTGQTKREGNIWHNLGENTIILFYNTNNEYMNNKQIN